jgi:uridine phosphorylase
MAASSSEFFIGKQYHIGASPGDLARFILLCGDPARVEKTALFFDEKAVRSTKHTREFSSVTSMFRGIPVTVMSTGIGCDNTEIAVIEAAQCVENPILIRIGSCGAIAENVLMGDLVISQFAVPRENTSSFYLPAGTVVEGDAGVTAALQQAAQHLECRHHVGGTCSTSSFYGGQGREVPGFPIRKEAKLENLLPFLLKLGVLNFEMEASTLFTLAKISTRGIRAGAVCAVYAERHANKGFDKAILAAAEQRCIQTGLEAISILAQQ